MKILKFLGIGLLFSMVLFYLFIRFWHPIVYTQIKGGIGSQLQWFGFEEKGNSMVNNSITNLQKRNRLSASDFHAASIQNTKNGNYDEAIQYLEEAVKLNPKDIDGYFGWLLLHYYRDYERALLHLFRHDSYTPNNLDYVGGDNNIYYAIGMCYKQLNQLDIALIYMNNAMDSELQLNEEKWMNHRILFHKARVHHLLNEPDSAIIYYDKVIHHWENTPEAYFYKGLLMNDLSRLDSACVYFEQSLDLVKKGHKMSEVYILEFDEIFEEQILDTIGYYCKQ